MTWQDALLQQCYKAMEQGGEVRIQFSIRYRDRQKTSVPIIRSYPDNQIICEEVKIKTEID